MLTQMPRGSIAGFSPPPYTVSVLVTCVKLFTQHNQNGEKHHTNAPPHYTISHYSGAELRVCCWKLVLFFLS